MDRAAFENKASYAHAARPCTRPQASPVRRRTRPRNIPIAMTMKNDWHGSMSMELREWAFGPRKMRYYHELFELLSYA